MDLKERGDGAQRHPWEVVRAKFFRELIQSHVELSTLTSLVDVGAGDGWFAQELLPLLPSSATVTCWDINYSPQDLEADLPDRVIRSISRPNESAGLVTLLDVLEHIPDDAGFLRDELVPLVGENGRLVISVPAHPKLFSDHDTALGHERRYRRSDLLAILGKSFEVLESGPLFSSLLAPRFVQVALEHMGRRGSEQGIGAWNHGKPVTKSVTGALQFDAWLGRWAAQHHVNIPGLSFWAVCRPAATQ